MTVRFIVRFVACLSIVSSLFFTAGLLLKAQPPTPVAKAWTASSKRMSARRITGASPSVDGRLDDDAWRSAVFAGDFLQKQPVEGGTPTETTEIAVLYDDDAVYIGARMSRRDPSLMHAQITRRDDAANTECIIVALDTYHDRRTAYSFLVTAAGAVGDFYQGSDNEGDRDDAFNPVWEGDASINEKGWTAEFRIPFSQLRFNDADEQVWGINVDRWMPDLNEDIYWVVVPRTEQGWSSRMGELVGIRGVRPSLRLELLPYTAGQARLDDVVDERDPFHEPVGGRAGMDLKMGLGPNLTLDATINPDFGQVEADPAQVNLTAFESVFGERRPFFVEGSNLLGSRGPTTWFYSRRIGASPHWSANAQFVDQPANTTILGAAKVTGRLASGLSVGALTAVTEREHARFTADPTQPFESIEVEPLAGYGVVRLQQEIGGGGTSAGVVLTGVHRAIDEASALDNVLARTALTGGADLDARFGDNDYQLELGAGFSHVAGSRAAIARVQGSSARYLGRPDADYVELDTARTALTGLLARAMLSKISGKWHGYLSAAARTPEFEINDLGRLETADDIDLSLGGSFRESELGGAMRGYNFGWDLGSTWNFGRVRTDSWLGMFGGITLENFWEINAASVLTLPSTSDNLTRGGPLAGVPFGWNFSLGVNPNYTDVIRPMANVLFSGDELGGHGISVAAGIAATIGAQWTLSIDPRWQRSSSPRQYVATVAEGNELTFGRRYVFARIDQSSISARMRVGYVIAPHVSLDLYAEPFAASGRYHDYGELPQPGATELRRYGASGGSAERQPTGAIEIVDGSSRFSVPSRDFNVLSFRTNAVLRWEWRPGSTLYLVWQRDGGAFDPDARDVVPGDLGKAVTADGGHTIALKISYWLPVD
jgi:hypothetical protein